MSKINKDILEKAVKDILAFAAGEEITYKGETKKGKKRNFVETIDMQLSLKNYDARKDKRFNGTIRLQNIPRPNMKICVLGNDVHCDQAKQFGFPHMSVDDIKKLNKNKKLVKKLAKKYDAFVASQALIKKIPRLMGPGLNRAGKFPTVVGPNEALDQKVDEMKSAVKFQLKKVLNLSVAVANVSMTEEQITQNINQSATFLTTLLKKNWQNIKVIYVKSTMGPSYQIFF